MNDSLVVWARALLYVGALVAVGRGLMTVLNANANANANSDPTASTLETPQRLMRGITLTAALLLVVAPLLLARQQLLALEMPWSELVMLVRETGWGRGFALLSCSAVATALLLCLKLSRGSAWVLLAVATTLSAAMGGLGHAAADEHWPVGARVLDAAHVWTVGAWMGGLLYTLLATRGTSPDDDYMNALWQRFSGVATIVAPLAVITGMLSGVRLLNGNAPRVIVGSEYGQMLLVKSGLVLVMLAIGAMQRSRIARGELPARRSVAIELGLAAWVLLVTATLTGTEPPGE